MAKRTKRTRTSKPDWAPRFLRLISKDGCILHACNGLHISRSNVYQRRDSDPEFARQLADALELAGESLIREARRRGEGGYDEPVIYKGQLSGVWIGPDGKPTDQGSPDAKFIPLTVRKYSDPLLLALLKAHHPAFREQRMLHGNDPDNPLPSVPEPVREIVVRTRQEAAALIEQAKKNG